VCENPIEVQKRIGVLPDSRGLYPRLTSRENIRYYGKLHGMRGEALEKSIDRLITLLNMQDIADRRTHGFSTGQRIKVAIARALVHDPPNVILDEPTNGLDVMSTRAMRNFICRLKEEGCCVLFSSHIMQEVSALCDQIVILHKGEVVACGSAEELKALTGEESLEDAFVSAIGSEDGLA
jgi:sodium transport system ATP-binding protein